MRTLFGIVLAVLVAACTTTARAEPSVEIGAPTALAAAASQPSESPTPTPSPRATATPEPTPTPAPTDPPDEPTPTSVPRPTVPPQPAYPGDPVLKLASGEVLQPTRGGCGAVSYMEEAIAIDECGPGTFDDDLAATAIDIERGAEVALVAPQGWRIGTDAALAEPWAVRIAGIGRLGGEVETYIGFPEGVGRTLDAGTARHRVIRVPVDAKPGDYLLQLDGGISSDGWSITRGRWYWHLRVR